MFLRYLRPSVSRERRGAASVTQYRCIAMRNQFLGQPIPKLDAPRETFDAASYNTHTGGDQLRLDRQSLKPLIVPRRRDISFGGQEIWIDRKKKFLEEDCCE